MNPSLPPGRHASKLPIANTWDACIDMIEEFYAKGWTDGLPVIPPTQEAVDLMLDAVKCDPLEVMGVVPPRMGVATVEALASLSVMAGCLPEYFPVVLAGAHAMMDEGFNLAGLQATTNPATPLAIVSGPIVEQIGLNHSTNLFGHGYRANATIGRALRLMMVVLGGGYPETGDKSSLGQSGKFSFCIAESPNNPWAPIHADVGIPPDKSAVTVIGVDSPIQFPAGGMSMNPQVVLRDDVDQIRVTWAVIRRGGEILLILNPRAAACLNEAGWTKETIRMQLHEQAKLPLQELLDRERISASPGEPTEWWPDGMDPVGPTTMLPVLRHPENLIIMVGGGTQAAFSACCPGWGYMGGFATSRQIEP